MSNLWNQPGVPHRGWRCVAVHDVRENRESAADADYATCEMCGKERIRFVHVMEHDDYGTLEAGCVCAGKMEDDYENAQRRETKARNRAARRAKWLTRAWRTSAKGNQYLNVEGHNVGVLTDSYGRGWKYRIDRNFSSECYPTIEQAKLALFDAFWRMLNGP